jgi:hypothetical protein
MFSLAFLTALAMPFGLHAALPNSGFLQQILSAQALLPANVETGDAAESFSAPQNLERPVGFGPDGSSYPVYNSYYLSGPKRLGLASTLHIRSSTERTCVTWKRSLQRALTGRSSGKRSTSPSLNR